MQEAGQAAADVQQAALRIEQHRSAAAAAEAAVAGCTAGLAQLQARCLGLASRLRAEEAARKARFPPQPWSALLDHPARKMRSSEQI